MSKCECGCGQAPAATTRLRKASCGCGQSIMRVSRVALALIAAECRACGGELLPDCLLDRVAAGDDTAVGELESKHDRALARVAAMPGRRADQYRCGDCHAIRAAHGPCKACRSERPPTTSYMHPRAARARGGDMPF